MARTPKLHSLSGDSHLLGGTGVHPRLGFRVEGEFNLKMLVQQVKPGKGLGLRAYRIPIRMNNE